MKRKLGYILTAALTLCLVGFVFAQIVPAAAVHASGETHVAASVQHTAEHASLTVKQAVQPAVIIAVGLVVGLFGVLAGAPLLDRKDI